MNAKLALSLYTLALGTVFILAYLQLLPLHLITVKWFDSLGHFVLYGLWGYFFGLAYRRTIFEVGGIAISRGIAISIVIAILEECLQYLSPYRSFTLSDMALSVLGILVAALILNFRNKLKLT